MVWIASASIAITIVANKGANTLLWVFYGLLLGPVALVHAIFGRRAQNRFVSGLVASMGVVPYPKRDEFIAPKRQSALGAGATSSRRISRKKK